MRRVTSDEAKEVAWAEQRREPSEARLRHPGWLHGKRGNEVIGREGYEAAESFGGVAVTVFVGHLAKAGSSFVRDSDGVHAIGRFARCSFASHVDTVAPTRR
jgi:hypothetical protein